MTMLINHNLFAKNMAGLYNKTTNALQKSLSKLSSGMRMSVTDFNDASGMEIAQQMASKLNGYSKAMAGGQDGISLLQTAEGALTEVDAMLVRMRELANQAANDTLTGQDRAYIRAEIDQLRTEIDRVGNTTHFNNKKLLNGNAAALWSAIPKETQAIIKGSLNSIDQFGQTAKTEGNYNIKLMAAPPGEAEVQKTSVFRAVDKDNRLWFATINSGSGLAPASEQTLPDFDENGTYTVSARTFEGGLRSPSDPNRYYGAVNQVYKTGNGTLTATPHTSIEANALIKFTVTDVSDTDVTFAYTGQEIGKDGQSSTLEGTLTLGSSAGQVLIGPRNQPVRFSVSNPSNFKTGDVVVYNVSARAQNPAAGEDGMLITVKGNSEIGGTEYNYVVNKSAAQDKNISLGVAYQDNKGDIQIGNIFLKTSDTFAADVKQGELAVFERGESHRAEGSKGVWNTSSLNTISSVKPSKLQEGSDYSVSVSIAQAYSARSWSVLQVKHSDGTISESLKGQTINSVVNNAGSVTDLGILSGGNGADVVDVSGILELTIGDIDVNATLARDTVDFTGIKFYGTGKDGKAVSGSATSTIVASTASNTGYYETSLTLGNYTLGSIRIDKNYLAPAVANGTLRSGDKVYISVEPKRRSGDVVLNLSGTDSSGNDVLPYNSSVVLNDSTDNKYPFVLTGGTSSPEVTISYLVNGNTDLSEYDWNNAGTINMTFTGSSGGALSAAEKRALNNNTITTLEWGSADTVKLDPEPGVYTAKAEDKLSNLTNFYDNSGKFLLDEPQTIKITHGDGKTASVTLYASDTLGDVAKKLNTAIADDLGQAKYVDDASKFATFVDETVENTSESVAGTLLIRSAISGSKGTLRFSGSEEMINALGLNTIQAATESVYTADVTDAHSGAEIASVKVTGNTLNGVLNQNVDVEFDAMAGVIREWDANSNSYKYNVSEYKSTVHLADNTLTLQMGIGSNESMFLSIGDMRSQALGLNDVLVTDRESAARSLSIIDNAIDKVSTQRAKLGAYTNRIEYNLDNMRIAEQNITAANSNIQDTDMAKEMINFTKLQIMLQAGNSMMAQANQTQESVLSLLR